MNVFDSLSFPAQPQPPHAHVRNDSAQLYDLERRLADIESRIGRLALVTHSLWELLKDRHGYTEEELRDWVNLTDLQDGQLDGRVRHTRPPLNCHKCGRVMTRALGRCLYCGEFAQGGDVFDRVHG